jgi:hemerythrin
MQTAHGAHAQSHVCVSRVALTGNLFVVVKAADATPVPEPGNFFGRGNCMNFAWNESLSTGIPKIDAQHKGFINILATLDETLRERPPDASHILDKNYRTQIVGIVMKLRDYAFLHFHTEEAVMRRSRYRYYLDHRREHDLFSLRLLRYELAVMDGDYMQAESLLEFVREWYKNHIKKMDMAYVGHI